MLIDARRKELTLVFYFTTLSLALIVQERYGSVDRALRRRWKPSDSVFDHEFQAIRAGWKGRGYLLFWALDQVWGTQFLRKEAWIIQDFNGIWTNDLAIPVRRSNQLSYEATDVGSWSFVGSNLPMRIESTMKWYLKWIKCELRIWNKVTMILAVMNAIFAIA